MMTVVFPVPIRIKIQVHTRCMLKDNYDDNAENTRSSIKKTSNGFHGYQLKVLENGDFESTMKFLRPTLLTE